MFALPHKGRANGENEGHVEHQAAQQVVRAQLQGYVSKSGPTPARQVVSSGDVA